MLYLYFSVMSPGTHVWPHVGPTNCRLRMHLGLVIPKTGKGARLRCADQYRWVMFAFSTYFWITNSVRNLLEWSEDIDEIHLRNHPKHLHIYPVCPSFIQGQIPVLPHWSDAENRHPKSNISPNSHHSCLIYTDWKCTCGQIHKNCIKVLFYSYFFAYFT